MDQPADHPPATGPDAYRGLGLAVRSTRQLAAMSLVTGAIIAIGPGLLNPLRFKWYILAAAVLVLLVPGTLYVIALAPLRRKKLGALILVSSAAGLQFLAAWGLLIVQLFLRPISMIPVLLALLWALAMTQMLYHLRLAFMAVRYDQADRVRGFEVQPARAAPTDSKQNPAWRA